MPAAADKRFIAAATLDRLDLFLATANRLGALGGGWRREPKESEFPSIGAGRQPGKRCVEGNGRFDSTVALRSCYEQVWDALMPQSAREAKSAWRPGQVQSDPLRVIVSEPRLDRGSAQ